MATVPGEQQQQDPLPYGPGETATSSSTPLTDIFEKYNPRAQEETGRLRVTFDKFKDMDPAQAQEILRLGSKSGVNIDLIADNLDEAKRVFDRADFNPEMFRKHDPLMLKWLLKNQHYIPLVKDDLSKGTLKDLELLFARKDDDTRPESQFEMEAVAEREATRKAAAWEITNAQEKARQEQASKTLGGQMYSAPLGYEAFPSKEAAYKAYYDQALERRKEVAEFVATSGKIGGWETVTRRFKENPAFWAAYAGDVVDIGKHVELYKAIEAEKNGTASEEQTDLLQELGMVAAAAERRGTDLMGDIAGILTEVPAFATDLALTGGAYGSSKAAMMASLRHAVKSALGRRLGTMAVKTAGAMFGTAVRTSLNVPKQIDGTIERMTQEYSVDRQTDGKLKIALSPHQPDGFIAAAGKTFGMNYIENLSEMTGVTMEKTAGWLKARLFGAWMTTHPQGTVGQFLTAVAKKTGWHGILGEMYEERVGELMRAGVGLEDYKLPTAEQLVTEFMAFAIPSTPGHILSLRKAKADHAAAVHDLDRETAIQNLIGQLALVKDSPDLAGPLLEQLSQMVTEDTDRKHRYVPAEKVKAMYEQRGIDPKQGIAQVLGESESYEAALAAKHDLEIPTAKLDALAVHDPEAAKFFLQEAVRAPGLETVKETEERVKRLTEEAQKAEESAAAAAATPEEQAKVEAKKKETESAGKIRDDVAAALREAGRPPREVRIGSKVAELFFVNAARRANEDPWEYYKGRALTIRSGRDAEEVPEIEGEEPEEAELDEVQELDEAGAVLTQPNIHYLTVNDESGTRFELFEAASQEDAFKQAQEKFPGATISRVGAEEVQQGIRDVVRRRREGGGFVLHQLKPGQEPKGFKAIERHLTEDEKKKLRTDSAKSLVKIFNDLPADADFAEAAKAGEAKRGWYKKSAAAIVSVFGPDAPRFAALLAAMSPQASVESNLINAVSTWKNWVAAGRPTDRESIVKVMGQSVQGDKGADSVLDAWINNSVRALSAEDPTAVVLSGPKVNSFMLNLRGVVNEVTNDAWMANFAAVDQAIFAGSLNAAGTDPGKGPGYLAMVAKVRRVAERLTKETGNQWTPDEVQETVWSWAKTIYEMAAAEGEERSAVELVKQGAVTDEAIASTPDFQKLFTQDADVRSILEQAGYGTALAAVEAEFGADARRDQGAAGERVEGADRKAPAGLVRSARRLDELLERRLAEKAADLKAKKAAQKKSLRLHQGDKNKTYAPMFHSKLRQVIEKKMPKFASADQLAGIVKDIKGDELYWLGMSEFLERHKDDKSISKEQVLSWLELHDLGIKEERLGAQGPETRKEISDKRVSLSKAHADLELAEEHLIRELVAAHVLERRDWVRFGMQAVALARKKGIAKAEIAEYEGAENNVKTLTQELKDLERKNRPNQYEQYTEPGGKDNRELLMTLPKRTEPLLSARQRLGGDPKEIDIKDSHTYSDQEDGEFGRVLRYPNGAEIAWDGDRRYYLLIENEDYVGSDLDRLEEKLAKWSDAESGRSRRSLNFQSSHYPDENIFAHVRFNDRVDKDGKKVLFIEEIQSDWHQAGRRLGYQGHEDEMIKELKERRHEIMGKVEDEGAKMPKEEVDKLVREERKLLRKIKTLQNGKNNGGSVPDAPFKKTWHEFALKRMIRYAAEHGYDRIAWTTGTQQNKRYNLATHVKHVAWARNDDGTYNVEAPLPNGTRGFSEQDMDVDRLEQVLGEELADQIIAKKTKGGTIKGKDLELKGEGMRGFYDKILPAFANKFAKKYGAQVEDIELPTQTVVDEEDEAVDEGDDGIERDELTMEDPYTVVQDEHPETGRPTFTVVDDSGDIAAFFETEQEALNDAAERNREVAITEREAAGLPALPGPEGTYSVLMDQGGFWVVDREGTRYERFDEEDDALDRADVMNAEHRQIQRDARLVENPYFRVTEGVNEHGTHGFHVVDRTGTRRVGTYDTRRDAEEVAVDLSKPVTEDNPMYTVDEERDTDPEVGHTHRVEDRAGNVESYHDSEEEAEEAADRLNQALMDEQDEQRDLRGNQPETVTGPFRVEENITENGQSEWMVLRGDEIINAYDSEAEASDRADGMNEEYAERQAAQQQPTEEGPYSVAQAETEEGVVIPGTLAVVNEHGETAEEFTGPDAERRTTAAAARMNREWTAETRGLPAPQQGAQQNLPAPQANQPPEEMDLGPYRIEYEEQGEPPFWRAVDPLGNPVQDYEVLETQEEARAALYELNGVTPPAATPALPAPRGKKKTKKIPMMTVHSLPMTEKLKDVALNEGLSLFQPGTGKKNRGRIVIGKSSFDLALLENADFTTFLHEFAGHFYLEVLNDLQSREGAAPEAKEDWARTLEWLGVKDTETWNAMSQEEKEPYHEKFAEGVERWFWEGKAPSTALRRVFHHCKVMFSRIYRAVTGTKGDLEEQQDRALGERSRLNDNMRRVFARMLATDEQIAEAQAEYGRPLYTLLLAAGMDPNKAAELAKLDEDARLAEEDRLRVRALRDLRNEEKADYKLHRAKVRAEVAAEVNERQDIKLLAHLQTGKKPDGSELDPGFVPFKLWDTALEEGDYVQAAALPEGVVGTKKEGAWHPKEVASIYGYQNAGEMINALVQVGDKESFIERLTDDRMIERYGPPITEEELKQAAEEEVHSVERKKKLRAELEGLLSLDPRVYQAGVRHFGGRPRIPDPEVVDREARRDVGREKMSGIRPAKWKAAEVKHARLALEAAIKGDWATAADEKLLQILNMARYQAALEAREYTAKAFDLVRQISKGDKKLAKGRNMDLVNAARAILSEYGIGKFDGKPLEYLEKLKQYEPEAYEALEPQIHAAAIDAKPYKEIPFEQFKGMMDTVRGFWDVSRQMQLMQVGNEKMERELVADILREALVEKGQPHAKAGYRKALSKWDKGNLWFLNAKAHLRRVESWADEMGKTFTKYIWRPVVDGADKYREERVKILKRLLDAAQKMGQLGDKPIRAPFYTFENEGEMVMALLHSGNMSNLRKLLLGREWSSEDPQDQELDVGVWDRWRREAMEQGIIRKEHYEFVQAVWDIFESMKPDVQKAHRQMFGLHFPEITADPIETKWGTYKGGYFPAKTDPDIVADGAKHLEQDAVEGFNNSYAWPTTGRGSTIERVQGYNKPLSLKFNLIPQHIDWALRYAHLEPRVRDVARLLRVPALQEAFNGFDPKALREMLTPWLQRAATQRIETGPTGPFDQWWRFVRRSAGMQIMALNIPNALQNLTGLVVANLKVKPKHLRNALFAYMTNPMKYAEEIRQVSPWMKTRTDAQALDMLEDVRDIVMDPGIFRKVQRAGQKHAYAFQRLTQNAVDNVVWGAAFEQATEEGKSTEDAMQEANAAVRLTQSSMNPEDVARYESRSAFGRLFTHMTSYFNMKANLLYTEFAKEMEEGGLKGGAGRALYLYAIGHAIPAMMAAAIFKTMAGGWDDDDDDGYLDELMATVFGSQVKELAAMVPGVGQAANAMFGGFTPEYYDDRVNLSPAITAIERGLHAPGEIYKAATEGKGVRRATKDALSMLGLFSGVPTSPVSRGLDYAMKVQAGDVEPENAVDYIRGLSTGKSGYKK